MLHNPEKLEVGPTNFPWHAMFNGYFIVIIEDVETKVIHNPIMFPGTVMHYENRIFDHFDF